MPNIETTEPPIEETRAGDETPKGSEFSRPRKSPAELADRHQLRQLLNAQRDIKEQLESGQITPDRGSQLTGELAKLALQLTGKETLYPDFEKLSLEILEQQYDSQIEIFRKNGITETLSSGAEGIVGINGKEYPVPDLETIIAELSEKQEDIALKIEQGLCRLQIVPFAKSITELSDSVGKSIVSHKQVGQLFSDNGDALNLNEQTPIEVWDKYRDADKTGEIVYYPKEYSQNHQGKTKAELLGDLSPTPGWQILLIEDQPIPKTGQGKTISGRPQLESGLSPNDYLKIQQGNPIYSNEVFHTPESWLAYFLTHLEETNQVIDDPFGAGSMRLLGAAYFSSDAGIPYGEWRRLNLQQAYMDRLGPTNIHVSYGTGAAIRII